MKPIAYFRSPFPSKFGIPRQSGIVPELDGYIEFVPEWRNPDTIRGLEDFDYIWLVWDFSANKSRKETSLVRPPLLGGNTKMGVFATRSPFRPNISGCPPYGLLPLTPPLRQILSFMFREETSWMPLPFGTSSPIWPTPTVTQMPAEDSQNRTNGRLYR